MGSKVVRNTMNCSRVEVVRIGLILAMLASGAGQFAVGSSIAPMNLEVISDYTGQAFVGEVESVRPYWAENPRRIESEVTFKNVEYFKGSPDKASDTFSLVVPGGKVGDTQMRICCAPQFASGEKWILMVLPEYKTFPVVGLYRGAFKVVTDEKGTDRIYSAHNQPVTGIDNRSFVEVNGSANYDPHAQVNEVHNMKVKVNTNAEATAGRGVRYTDFVANLKTVLETSKKYRLDQQAGKRVLVEYSPVSLKRAKGEADKEDDSTSILRGKGQVKKADVKARERGNEQ